MVTVRITSTARKHGADEEPDLFALNNEAQLVGTFGDQELYVGVDSYGVELEMILLPDDRDPNRMACIHAMPTRYRDEED